MPPPAHPRHRSIRAIVRATLLVAWLCVAAAPPALAAQPSDAYELHVRFDPAAARLAVSGVVRFPSPVADSTAPLRLSLGRGVLAPEFESIAAATAPARRGAWAVVDSTEDDLVWSPAPGGAAIAAVRFRYAVSSPAPRYLFDVGHDYALAEAGEHSWYPRRIETRAHGAIEYDVPRGWTVLSTGVRTALPAAGDRERCRYSAPFASELWFAAARFATYRLDGPIPVTVCTISPGLDAPRLAARTSRTLAALCRVFGRFPYPALSLIEVPPAVAARAGGFNGIGASGAIAFETSFLEPFHLAHVAHELGHQWWGQSLSRSPGSEGGDYMLDEAMTEYGALEVAEALEGDAVAEAYRRRDMPRAAGGGNYGAVEYLKLAAAGEDTALCCLPDAPVSYRLARSKGARAWYALARQFGRDRFDAALARIAARRAYENVTWGGFRADLVRELGPAVTPLWHEWFDRAGTPRWDVTWEQSRGRLSVVVTQSAPAYHVAVDVEIATVARTHIGTLMLTGAVTRATFAEPDTVIDVQVDPRFRILHATPEYAAEAAALVPDTRARLLVQAGRAAVAETLLAHALERVAEPDVHAATFLFASTLARFAEERKDWDAAAALAERAIAAPTRNADVLPFTYVRLARVSAPLGHWARVAFAARAAIAADAASGSRAGVAAECARLLAEARRHGVP